MTTTTTTTTSTSASSARHAAPFSNCTTTTTTTTTTTSHASSHTTTSPRAATAAAHGGAPISDHSNSHSNAPPSTSGGGGGGVLASIFGLRAALRTKSTLGLNATANANANATSASASHAPSGASSRVVGRPAPPSSSACALTWTAYARRRPPSASSLSASSLHHAAAAASASASSSSARLPRRSASFITTTATASAASGARQSSDAPLPSSSRRTSLLYDERADDRPGAGFSYATTKAADLGAGAYFGFPYHHHHHQQQQHYAPLYGIDVPRAASTRSMHDFGMQFPSPPPPSSSSSRPSSSTLPSAASAAALEAARTPAPMRRSYEHHQQLPLPRSRSAQDLSRSTFPEDINDDVEQGFVDEQGRAVSRSKFSASTGASGASRERTLSRGGGRRPRRRRDDGAPASSDERPRLPKRHASLGNLLSSVGSSARSSESRSRPFMDRSASARQSPSTALLASSNGSASPPSAATSTPSKLRLRATKSADKLRSLARIASAAPLASPTSTTEQPCDVQSGALAPPRASTTSSSAGAVRALWRRHKHDDSFGTTTTAGALSSSDDHHERTSSHGHASLQSATTTSTGADRGARRLLSKLASRAGNKAAASLTRLKGKHENAATAAQTMMRSSIDQSSSSHEGDPNSPLVALAERRHIVSEVPKQERTSRTPLTATMRHSETAHRHVSALNFAAKASATLLPAAQLGHRVSEELDDSDDSCSSDEGVYLSPGSAGATSTSVRDSWASSGHCASPARFRDLISSGSAASSPRTNSLNLPVPSEGSDSPRCHQDDLEGSPASQTSSARRLAMGPEAAITVSSEQTECMREVCGATFDLAALVSALKLSPIPPPETSEQPQKMLSPEQQSISLEGLTASLRALIYPAHAQAPSPAVSDVPDDLVRLLHSLEQHASELGSRQSLLGVNLDSLTVSPARPDEPTTRTFDGMFTTADVALRSLQDESMLRGEDSMANEDDAPRMRDSVREYMELERPSCGDKMLEIDDDVPLQPLKTALSSPRDSVVSSNEGSWDHALGSSSSELDTREIAGSPCPANGQRRTLASRIVPVVAPRLPKESFRSIDSILQEYTTTLPELGEAADEQPQDFTTHTTLSSELDVHSTRSSPCPKPRSTSIPMLTARRQLPRPRSSPFSNSFNPLAEFKRKRGDDESTRNSLRDSYRSDVEDATVEVAERASRPSASPRFVRPIKAASRSGLPRPKRFSSLSFSEQAAVPPDTPPPSSPSQASRRSSSASYESRHLSEARQEPAMQLVRPVNPMRTSYASLRPALSPIQQEPPTPELSRTSSAALAELADSVDALIEQGFCLSPGSVDLHLTTIGDSDDDDKVEVLEGEDVGDGAQQKFARYLFEADMEVKRSRGMYFDTDRSIEAVAHWRIPRGAYEVLEFLFDSQRRFKSLLSLSKTRDVFSLQTSPPSEDELDLPVDVEYDSPERIEHEIFSFDSVDIEAMGIAPPPVEVVEPKPLLNRSVAILRSSDGGRSAKSEHSPFTALPPRLAPRLNKAALRRPLAAKQANVGAAEQQVKPAPPRPRPGDLIQPIETVKPMAQQQRNVDTAFLGKSASKRRKAQFDAARRRLEGVGAPSEQRSDSDDEDTTAEHARSKAAIKGVLQGGGESSGLLVTSPRLTSSRPRPRRRAGISSMR